MADPDLSNSKARRDAEARAERPRTPELHPFAAFDTAGLLRSAAAKRQQGSLDDTARLIRQQCGECLGSVAHRLSQPLTALRGSLELALRSELSARDSRAALEQAFELTKIVVKLLTSMRDLAEAARADAPPTNLSLRDLVKEAVEDLQGLAGSRKVHLALTASLEAPVLAPPDLLREVIAKLIWLVIQRSPADGEVRLEVSAGGSFACFLLADRGHYKPAEFDLASFETADLGCLFAEAAKAGCLDWSIIKVLAESLGGTLDAAPLEPQGCCFRLQLPLANPPNQ